MTEHQQQRPCGASPATGDLVCTLAHGHAAWHRNWQGITWRDDDAPGKHARGALPPRRDRGHSHDVDTPCVPETCTGHPAWTALRDGATATVMADPLTPSGRQAGKATAAILAALFPDNPPPDLATAVEWQADRLDTIRRMSAAYGDQKARAEKAEAKHVGAVEYAETLERELAEVRRQREHAEATCEARGELLNELEEIVREAAGVLSIRLANTDDDDATEEGWDGQCGDRHEWPNADAGHPDAVGACTLEPGHEGWHRDNLAGGCWPPVAEPTNRAGMTVARCDARLAVNYGTEGQVLVCELDVHRPGVAGVAHEATDAGTTYRWSS